MTTKRTFHPHTKFMLPGGAKSLTRSAGFIMSAANITEPALLIRIAKLFKPRMSGTAVYEATRGVWVVSERRDAVKYALCVANGTVQEVYEVGTWQPAGTASYTTRPRNQVTVAGRWEFVGKVAAPYIRNKYVGRSVAHYFRRGNVNPINYVNV